MRNIFGHFIAKKIFTIKYFIYNTSIEYANRLKIHRRRLKSFEFQL